MAARRCRRSRSTKSSCATRPCRRPSRSRCPNERLGEEVAAAVVLRLRRRSREPTERELQDFVAQTVAPFKVPRRIVLVDEIPKGPTGKVQRVGLAERLGPLLAATRHRGSARRSSDSARARWSDLCSSPRPARVGPLDDFFALGGDSILAAEAVARVRELVGRPDLPLVADRPCADTRARWRTRSRGVRLGRSRGSPHPGGRSGAPIFLAHGVDGEIVLFAGLARLLGRRPPGLRAPGAREPEAGERPVESVEALAELLPRGHASVQPTGPYLLGALLHGRDGRARARASARGGGASRRSSSSTRASGAQRAR